MKKWENIADFGVVIIIDYREFTLDNEELYFEVSICDFPNLMIAAVNYCHWWLLFFQILFETKTKINQINLQFTVYKTVWPPFITLCYKKLINSLTKL